MAIPEKPNYEGMTKAQLIEIIHETNRQRGADDALLRANREELKDNERDMNRMRDTLLELEKRCAHLQGYVERVREFDRPTPRQEIEQTVSIRIPDEMGGECYSRAMSDEKPWHHQRRNL